MNIDIDRLRISLHGVSAQMIDEAMLGIDKELSLRLQKQGLGRGPAQRAFAVSIDEMALSPIHSDATLNVAGLRGLIADRLCEAIQTESESMPTTPGSDA
jgi:hypothetical protein